MMENKITFDRATSLGWQTVSGIAFGLLAVAEYKDAGAFLDGHTKYGVFHHPTGLLIPRATFLSRMKAVAVARRLQHLREWELVRRRGKGKKPGSVIFPKKAKDELSVQVPKAIAGIK